MSWLSLIKQWPVTTPPDEVLEVRPGVNVFSGLKLVLKVRVWREAEQRWVDVPDEASSIDGARL